MISIDVVDQIRLVAFWLCFTRWVTIMFQLPIFDNVGIPSIAKVLTSLLVTYAFFPYLESSIMADIQYVGQDNFWFLTIFQAIVGLTIGFLVKIILQLYIAAGSLITQQIGFAAIQYFDPGTSQNIGPVEKLIHWVVVIMIVSSGALLPMFSGIFNSFASISLADMGNLAASPAYYQKFFISLFESAILLASPLLFTNILLNCVLGIVARMVPQMNILMVSFVINIGVGLFVMSTISHEFFNVAYKNYVQYLGDWFQFIK